MKPLRRRLPPIASIAAIAAGLLPAASVPAQIATDGSLGTAARNLAGPNYVIPETLGRLAGTNLFHSFRTFSISRGESATFTTQTPAIANVISRVSGGVASTIDGAIRLDAPTGTPAFYFINPAGVTFGAGASIDVPGAFHAGTADNVAFADGSRFQADPARSSSFSTAAPTAFGFLGDQRATLTLAPGAGLFARPGQAIGLAGGDVTIDNSGAAADGGDLRVAATGRSAVDVPFAGSLPPAAGQLTVVDGGWLGAETQDSGHRGSIRLAAGDVLIDGRGNPSGTGLFGSAFGGQGQGACIEIAAGGSFSLRDGGRIAADTHTGRDAGSIGIVSPQVTIEDSVISADSYGAGRAGTIAVSGGRIALAAGGEIWASAQDRGPAGDISLAASESIDISGRSAGLRRSAVVVLTRGRAPAGRIDLDAPQVVIHDDGLVSGFAVGDTLAATAGQVHVRAVDLVLEDGGKISVEGYDSMGRGSVVVEASGSVRIRGRGEEPDPSPGADTVSTGILGHGTDLRIDADEISVSESGAIRSESWWQDVPGRIDINSRRLTLASGGHISGNALGHSGTPGIGAPIIIAASEFVHVEGSRNGRDSTIASGARSSGGAGTIGITTPWLRVADDGVINTSTGRFGTAGAGRIDIAVDRLELVAGGRLASIEWGHAASGGRIAVAARRSIDLDGGAISAWGANEAAAGRIVLSAPEVRLRGGLITTSNDENALSGGIRIDAGQLLLSDASRIESSSTSTAGGGDIDLRVDGVVRIDNSAITTTATRAGGGDITVGGATPGSGAGAVLLRNSLITTSVTGASGNGGDIAIRTDALALATGFIQANTSASGASGGNIGIDAPLLVASGNRLLLGGSTQHAFAIDRFGFNVIQAAAPDGVNGVIDVTSPALDITASLGALGTPLLDSGGLGRNPCQATGGSSLSVNGRGGLAASAREPLRVDPPGMAPQAGNRSAARPLALLAVNGNCR